jgi:hypothetical protein
MRMRSSSSETYDQRLRKVSGVRWIDWLDVHEFTDDVPLFCSARVHEPEQRRFGKTMSNSYSDCKSK